jgi:hypothetical protein
MKARSVAVAVLLCFAGAVLCLAQDVQLGSWKLNEAKSKFSPGAPKSTSGVYEASGDSIKVTLDGTGFDGKPSHNVWTGKFDGKDYPVTGDATQTSRSYTAVDDHTLKFVVKSGSTTILTGLITISADGKTRIVKATGTTKAGKKVNYTAVYDKQ